jgi:hypothetical protein
MDPVMIEVAMPISLSDAHNHKVAMSNIRIEEHLSRRTGRDTTHTDHAECGMSLPAVLIDIWFLNLTHGRTP